MSKSKRDARFQKIRTWAEERNLYKLGDVDTQVIKLGEEYGELCRAVLKSNEEAIEDAIGDMVIVLTNLCGLRGTLIEDVIDYSYDIIKNRKGKMIDGTFVKDEDEDDETE